MELDPTPARHRARVAPTAGQGDGGPGGGVPPAAAGPEGAATDQAAATSERGVPERMWRQGVVRPFRQFVMTEHPAWERFFARRCPHLAGMIAYFGILSIIPAAFLFISTLGLLGYLEAQGWVVQQLTYVMPAQGVDTIVDTVTSLRRNIGSLGLIGALGLVWGASNFLSCIESGLNIIYGVNNRIFLRQKALVLLVMLVSLALMTVGTIAVTLAVPLLRQADTFAETTLHVNVTDAGMSVLVSLAFAFTFFLVCYRFLPNTDVRFSDVWRGAFAAAVLFEVSIHVLPLYLTFNEGSALLKAFAGAFIVLIWFYLMAFTLLAGGVYNWWRGERRRRGALASPPLEQA